MSDYPQLLNVADVARLLGICQRSVWNHAERGVIPRPIKLGGRRLWYPGPLMEALARLHAQAQQPDGGQEGRP